jgi:hypothetical protein
LVVGHGNPLISSQGIRPGRAVVLDWVVLDLTGFGVVLACCIIVEIDDFS